MKKLLFLFAPIIVIFAIGFGVAYFGLVEVPGITPKKKVKNIVATVNPKNGLFYDNMVPVLKALGQMTKAAEEEEKRKKNAPPAKKKPTPPPSTEPGEMKLASVWNSMDVEKLKLLVTSWTPQDVAKVALRMEEDQVTALLSALDPAKANAICKAMAARANQIKAEAEALKEAQKN